MSNNEPIKILYINNKCVGNCPCYHFISLLNNNNKEYKALMSSDKIYELCLKLKFKPSWHITNNCNKYKIKEKCVIS